MREAFGMRVLTGDRKALDRMAAAEEEGPEASIFCVDDLRVWDWGSPHHKILESIANWLFDAYQRVQHDAKAAVMAERVRLRSALAVDVDGVVLDVAEELGPDATIGVVGKRELVAVMTGIHETLQTLVDRAKETRPNGGLEAKRSVRTKDVQSISSSVTVSRLQHDSRKLRERLKVAENRLKVAEKEKRDLLVALRRNWYEPMAADSLLADIDREREKNLRLQSVVDEMYSTINLTTTR